MSWTRIAILASLLWAVTGPVCAEDATLSQQRDHSQVERLMEMGRWKAAEMGAMEFLREHEDAPRWMKSSVWLNIARSREKRGKEVKAAEAYVQSVDEDDEEKRWARMAAEDLMAMATREMRLWKSGERKGLLKGNARTRALEVMEKALEVAPYEADADSLQFFVGQVLQLLQIIPDRADKLP